MPLPLIFTPLPMIQTYINLLPFQCQPSSNARSQSRLAMSSTINSDLQSISEWGTRNFVKFNTSKTQLLTISLSNTPSNYPIIFEDSEIPSLNSVNILGLQISSSFLGGTILSKLLSQPQKNWGFSFVVNNILMLLNYSNCILVLFVPAWNIALISGVLPLILLFLIGLNQRLSAWLVIPPWPRLLTLCLFGARWLHYLFSTAITLVTVLMNWPPVFHLQWPGHVPHVRQHLPTTIVWNSPMRELNRFQWWFPPFYFPPLELSPFLCISGFPSTFLPSKGRSITTLGARWHDFFLLHFLDIFIISF